MPSFPSRVPSPNRRKAPPRAKRERPPKRRKNNATPINWKIPAATTRWWKSYANLQQLQAERAKQQAVLQSALDALQQRARGLTLQIQGIQQDIVP
ncbi:hypothetical protein JOS77_15855 [Chromobacterium haemolyticum]|nr:hypothetical protein JOS77_15855 [Chromobacterium haemolyticum]